MKEEEQLKTKILGSILSIQLTIGFCSLRRQRSGSRVSKGKSWGCVKRGGHQDLVGCPPAWLDPKTGKKKITSPHMPIICIACSRFGVRIKTFPTFLCRWRMNAHVSNASHSSCMHLNRWGRQETIKHVWFRFMYSAFSIRQSQLHSSASHT